MKKTTLLLTLILSAFAFSVSAQDEFSSRRLNDLVYNLKRQTVDLVDRTSEDLRRGNNNSRLGHRSRVSRPATRRERRTFRPDGA